LHAGGAGSGKPIIFETFNFATLFRKNARKKSDSGRWRLPPKEEYGYISHIYIELINRGIIQMCDVGKKMHQARVEKRENTSSTSKSQISHHS
jgi:hypothetical protein